MSHIDLAAGVPLASSHGGEGDGRGDGWNGTDAFDGGDDSFGPPDAQEYGPAPSVVQESTPASRMTSQEIAWRDNEVKKCVKARMTGKQIYELSQSWDRPFPHINHLWRKIKRLRLKVIEEREQLPHKRAICEVFIRCGMCCHSNGYKITHWKIECSMGAGVRVDLFLVIEGHGVRRVRLFEVQRTFKASWIWERKARRLKALRKQKGQEPFRVVFLIEDIDASEKYKFSAVNKVYDILCKTMADSPDMLLFLVEWLPDFRIQYDVLMEDIYMSNRKRRESLI